MDDITLKNTAVLCIIVIIAVTTCQGILTKGHIAVGIYCRGQCNMSIAVSCSSCAVMLLLITELFLLLHEPQKTLPVLSVGRTTSKIVPFHGGSWPHQYMVSWTHEWASKQHLDRFSRFCTYAHHTDRHTQTMLGVTSVASVMRPNNGSDKFL